MSTFSDNMSSMISSMREVDISNSSRSHKIMVESGCDVMGILNTMKEDQVDHIYCKFSSAFVKVLVLLSIQLLSCRLLSFFDLNSIVKLLQNGCWMLLSTSYFIQPLHMLLFHILIAFNQMKSFPELSGKCLQSAVYWLHQSIMNARNTYQVSVS